jgi:hypothetical protein
MREDHPMTALQTQRASRSVRLLTAITCACAMTTGGCAQTSTAYEYENQRVFVTPGAAVTTLVDAMQRQDAAAIEDIFGEEASALLASGDPIADRAQHEVFLVAMNEGWTLEPLTDTSRELIVGSELWPFPIPIVRDARGWWFDTASGREEVHARRVGRNELAAIDAMLTYVYAQEEYASESRDGLPTGAYARRAVSAPGRHDGLYWATRPGDPPSPLGAFAAAAVAAGYSDEHSDTPRPYYGYLYRVLTSQGPDAPGGARDYMVDGIMTGGFALVAYPVEYGNSGVMTFIVNQDGIVYEADLGPDTVSIASAMQAFNPGAEWQVVE